MITIEQIKSLRDKTSVSVMQVKNALEEAMGDEEKAIEILKKQSGGIALKKSDRALGAGKIVSYIHGDGTIGVLLEMSSETDFVAGNDEFKNLMHNIAMHIAAMDSENKETILSEPFIKDESMTISNLIEQAVQKFGERIEISRFTRFSSR